jgi:rubredoxin
MVDDSGITWSCPQCDRVNPLDADRCEVCDFAFTELLATPESGDDRPERDPGTATLLSLVLPGAGHAYLGMWGQAVARAIISTWVVAVAFFAGRSGGPGAMPILGLFGIAAFGLWLVSAHDAYREATGDPRAALLRDRMFLYTVLGLLGLLAIVVFTAALQVRG